VRPVFKWLAWIVGIPSAAFAVLLAAAFWTIHQREANFPELPPGERQLAIFDAFSWAVINNYYDREFVEKKWPPLRDEWRLKAARVRDDATLYDQVFVPLSQLVPSSHLAAIPPPALIEAARKQASQQSGSRRSPLDRGFIFARVRRGGGTAGIVDEVIAGSPAADAGIEPGWLIRSLPGGLVDHETGVFLALGSPELRLESELKDNLTIQDSSIASQADFDAKYLRSVTYAYVASPVRTPFESRDIEGVTYVRFDTFQDPKIIDQALAALERAGPAGVALDLRRNSGGLVSEELRFASRVLQENALIGTEITRTRRIERRAGPGEKFMGRIVVLIGPSTASAGEVLAAALQDHKRARLLGRRTAGATLTSDNFPLPDGGYAQVAFADYLRTDGRRIEGTGVFPDLGIMPTNADARAGRDPALERAIRELRELARPMAASGSPPPPG
jgi:carboxyl-terminal processing protease